MLIMEREQFEKYLHEYVMNKSKVQEKCYDFSNCDYIAFMQPFNIGEKVDIEKASLEYFYYYSMEDKIIYENDWCEGQTYVALFTICPFSEIRQYIMNTIKYKTKLPEIDYWLRDNVYRNPEIEFNQYLPHLEHNNEEVGIVDIIATLHNYLHECVDGTLYNYAFHWCNKIGSDCDDDIFSIGDEE